MQTFSFLSHLEVSGVDASTFLDAQLSINVSSLAIDSRRLACWCNAKGQVIASLLVIRTKTDRYTLVLEKDLVNKVQQRLSMYVLRSKVDIAHNPQIIVTSNEQGPDSPFWQNIQLTPTNDETLITTGLNIFQSLFVTAGWAWLCPATSEKYLPQMLAMEYWQAIDYEKGCYPGQEVIARAHYLGRVKRRLWLVQIAATVSDTCSASGRNHGTDIQASDGTVVGQLVESVANDTSIVALAVLHDNHKDKTLSCEFNGSHYQVKTQYPISAGI